MKNKVTSLCCAAFLLSWVGASVFSAYAKPEKKICDDCEINYIGCWEREGGCLNKTCNEQRCSPKHDKCCCIHRKHCECNIVPPTGKPK